MTHFKSKPGLSVSFGCSRLLKGALLGLGALLLTGCASSNSQDPFESFNRGVYHFNDAVDKVALKPAALAYEAIMPEPAKQASGNFFSNLDDLVTTLNDLLQFKFAEAASDGSRFLFNSTFGLFGVMDVADGLEKRNEDFGQTLGYWGVGSGPYLMLPFIGPSSLRDVTRYPVDPNPIADIDHSRTRNQLMLAKVVETRASLLEKEAILDEAAIDRYAFIRDTYLQYRKNLVYDGDPPFEYDEEFEEDVSDGALFMPGLTLSEQRQLSTGAYGREHARQPYLAF